MNNRGEFSSRLGFVLAASGSAVGLGNIWGFPSQVAQNGGAAFVLVYLLLAFLLAYPVLMAELVIGRATKSNVIDALGEITNSKVGRYVGVWGAITASLILSFYAIVAGWMMAYFIEAILALFGGDSILSWFTDSSISRNWLFCSVFLFFTALIVTGGVKQGIEKWSVRLMPTLIILIVLLILYVSSQPGAGAGWKAYLLPDFSIIFDPELLISAMGQAFFSMSLGVGTMLVYGSYIAKKENLPSLGASVALVDIGVAVLAGMLIIPAMYVAQANGVSIFADDGQLVEGGALIFSVLPNLFDSIGFFGGVIAIVFFLLMTIASLTSSISMLEVPVSYLVENKALPRSRSVWLMSTIIFLMSSIIIFNFESLFGLVIAFTTEYSQPLLGLLICIFVSWIWHRDAALEELSAGHPDIKNSFFGKVWPVYVKFICPVIIIVMFVRTIWS
ncbi:sodium-dependent transporter [Opacimonas viscosa]|uniref:Sodium-dependent transporter n=1 Tax=Opacimonas viscosa TaxID=2961944 RepID=A0AA41X109_9ALTE|nr:sodium-dependent transporter [Opacimonas viscosa]MCP3427521.1 sodium-dependent transporter [Opacimonas viscosa]